MVKGISRQVIVVQSPDRKLFEQAIFILRADAVGKEGVTDEMLLKEAKQALRQQGVRGHSLRGPAWACGGAGLMGLAWLAASLF